MSASLVFGSAIHAALELHYRELLVQGSPPDLEELLGAYQSAWAARDLGSIRFGKEDDPEQFSELARRMLLAFQESDLANPAGTILAVEEELRGPLIPGCPDLLARIDLAVECGDRLVLTDFKTARARWSADQAEDAGEQLLLYADLVRALAPGKRLSLEFAVLTKGKAPSVTRHAVAAEPAQIRRIKQVVQRVWQGIEAGLFYPAPSVMNCPGCPFRKPCRVWSG